MPPSSAIPLYAEAVVSVTPKYFRISFLRSSKDTLVLGQAKRYTLREKADAILQMHVM